MITRVDSKLAIFFGDAAACPVGHKDPSFKHYLDDLRHELHLSHLVVNHQVHGTDGLFIKQNDILDDPVLYKQNEGDYLITNKPKTGIGAITADCLPIIFYASASDTIAIAHAGWKGSFAGIAKEVLDDLEHNANIKPSELQIYFGPAAGVCCYEISEDFLHNVNRYPFRDELIERRDGKLYFNNSLFNKKLLIQAGVPEAAINTDNNHCTICNQQYYSYRRIIDKENYKTQATIAWIE
jgi:polyphenol oxidase